jgi:hypothetical protein
VRTCGEVEYRDPMLGSPPHTHLLVGENRTTKEGELSKARTFGGSDFRWRRWRRWRWRWRKEGRWRRRRHNGSSKQRCREPAGAPPLYVARRATGAGVTKQCQRDEACRNRRRARAPPHAIRASRSAAGRHGRAPEEGGTQRFRQRHSDVPSEALRGFIRGLRGLICGFEATCVSSSRNSSMASAGPRSVHASVCSGAAVTCAGGARRACQPGSHQATRGSSSPSPRRCSRRMAVHVGHGLSALKLNQLKRRPGRCYTGM